MPSLGFYNLGVFFTILAPVILALSILLAAAISGQSLIGFIYIMGLIMLYIPIWPMVARLMRVPLPEGARPALCALFNVPKMENAYASPAFYIMLHAYTLIYIMWPTFWSAGTIPSTGMIFMIVMAFLMAFTVYVRSCLLKCIPTEPIKLLIAVGIALLVGGIWGAIIGEVSKKTNGQGWSFNVSSGIQSNKLKCDKADERNMRCTVSKDNISLGTVS